jgi:hypothetical protein
MPVFEYRVLSSVMRGRFGVRGCLHLAGAVALWLVAIPLAPALAEDLWAPIVLRIVDASQPEYGWREVSGGVDAGRDQWLAYSGMTVAPWSSNIYSDGWRLRVGGGYGQYTYDRGVSDNGGCGTLQTAACRYHSEHYRVDHSYAEALIGYYLRLGQLTAKAFAGASMSSEQHAKSDLKSKSDGTEYGAKGVLELWLNMGDDAWTSLDFSYATTRNETSARWRSGWRIQPWLSVGPELRYDKNIESGEGEWNGRAGLFVRYEWAGGEVSLAGGVSERVGDWASEDASPYGTLNVLFQY